MARLNAKLDGEEWITIHEIEEAVEILPGFVSIILKYELRCSTASARWVLYVLTQENKRGRVADSESLLQIYDNSDQRHFHEVVAGDETWMHYYESWEKSTILSVGAKRRKPVSNRKEKSTSERDTVHEIHEILRLTRNHVTPKKQQQQKNLREEMKSISGKYHRKCVLVEVNRVYRRVRTHTGTRGIKHFYESAPAHKCRLVR